MPARRAPIPAPRAPAAAAVLLLALALAGCGGGEPGGIQRLAVRFEPDAGIDAGRPWSEADPALTLLPGPDEGSFRVRTMHPAAAWTANARLPGTWWAQRGFQGNAVGGGERGLRVEADGEELAYLSTRGMRIDPAAIRPGFFGTAGARLFVTRAPTAGAPQETVQEELVDLGHGDSGANRIALGPLAGEGFLVAPGVPARAACSFDGPMWLRFVAKLSAAPGRTAKLVLRVDDGAPVELRIDADRPPCAYEVALEAPRGEHTLEVALEGGGPALCGVFAPVLAPRVDPGARSGGGPGSAEPAPANLVLFVGDTFRADNLACYGGDPAVAPELDRFADGAARFATAWASSPWTLPSHAAMFSALLPHQARVASIADRLSDEALTLAEVLLAAGWRTGAITDGAFVSPAFGLDQGFEWFDSRRKDPAETLAAVEEFLARDDGRPFFLFVHSYRAHHPYVPDPDASPETLRALGLREGIDLADYAAKPVSVPGWTSEWEPDEATAQRMRDYAALYRAASHALDRLFGATRDLVDAEADPARTFLVFTSDHGEAFWEHGVAEHGNGVWNEHLRIPLLLRGPGIEAGPRPMPASLVDLPRTLATLAGATPADRWGGVDLFAARTNVPVLAFQCDMAGGPSAWALVADGKKLVGDELGGAPADALVHAFDLATDPEERVERRDEPWAAALRAGHADALDRAFLPLLERVESTPGDATMDELRELGYVGGE